jgi:hypothetical protein
VCRPLVAGPLEHPVIRKANNHLLPAKGARWSGFNSDATVGQVWQWKLTRRPTQRLGKLMSSFTNEVSTMAIEEPDQTQRAWLTQLSKAPYLEDIWKGIEKLCGKQDRAKTRFFIRDLIAARSIAGAADILPDYLANAINTERVIRFLKGSPPFPTPLLKFANPTFLAQLEDLASCSRKQAGRIHVSREKVNQRRQYGVFMQLLSQTMQEFFKHWLDREVAQFTNIFFLRANVGKDAVRAARRNGRPGIAA